MMPADLDMVIDLFTIVVREYDPAIRFFVDTLGFDLSRTPLL